MERAPCVRWLKVSVFTSALLAKMPSAHAQYVRSFAVVRSQIWRSGGPLGSFHGELKKHSRAQSRVESVRRERLPERWIKLAATCRTGQLFGARAAADQSLTLSQPTAASDVLPSPPPAPSSNEMKTVLCSVQSGKLCCWFGRENTPFLQSFQ